MNRVEGIISGIKRRFDAHTARLDDDPVVVEVYRGYRSGDRLFVQGRVLHDHPVDATREDGLWRNFVNAARRLESDELAGARVALTYRDYRIEVTTDREGFFHVHQAIAADANPDAWSGVEARILALPHGIPVPDAVFRGEVVDIQEASEIAVVTDIDDTILQTGITSLLKLRALYLTLARNAYSRVSFAGAPALYAALHRGPGDEPQDNPMFYLSNSPWNLYTMLHRFLEVAGFPKGPIFLRDIGLGTAERITGVSHKESSLRRLLADFPSVRFVLVGDSGERDADIYHRIAGEHPGRVAAVVIRNVKNNANARRIRRLFARQDPARNYYLVPDSAAAARELSALGLVSPGQVEAVARATRPRKQP